MSSAKFHPSEFRQSSFASRLTYLQHAHHEDTPVYLGEDPWRNSLYISSVSTQRQQIPAMEVLWSVLTMVLASAKNFETLVAVRFLVGV